MGSTFRFRAVVIGALAACVSASEEYFEGDGTSYSLGQVSSGNCNFMSAIPSASTNYVALNEAQWNKFGGCGRCIEVSCIDEKCTVQNKTAVVQVLDRCPECAHGALDLSPTVFKTITGLDPNRLKVRWRFADCPNPGNVQVCLKEGSNPEWIAVQPTNGVVGVKSITINGATSTMLDGAYYYVVTTTKADLSALKVSVTSITGEVITGTYSLKAGQCTDTRKQFKSKSAKSQSPSLSTTPATHKSPTVAPAAPSAIPTVPTTNPPQTKGSSEVSQDSDSDGLKTDQSSQSDDDTSQLDQKPPIESAQDETSTPTTPVPEITPDVMPDTMPNIPPPSTVPPEVTMAPTEVPSTAPSDVPTQSSDASKCRVKNRSHRK